MFESKFVREKISDVITKGMYAFSGVVHTEVGKLQAHILGIETAINISNNHIEDLETRLAAERAILKANQVDFDEYQKILGKVTRLNIRI